MKPTVTIEGNVGKQLKKIEISSLESDFVGYL